MNRLGLLVFLAAVAAGVCRASAIRDNEVVRGAPRIRSGDELLSSVVNDCIGADSAMECLKIRVLTYLDTVLGYSESGARSLAEDDVDKLIFNRVGRILNKNEFRLSLPEVFQGAQVTYRADRGLDVDFPEGQESDPETVEARGMLKKKLLLPVLLLLKLKMKALMPIFLAIIGLKATKALLLSKVAIILVVGFLVVQLMKKGGMPMPMAMTPAPEPTAPSTAYGPAASASATAAASTPVDSYSPHWEPASSGPYARVWDTTSAHNMAYNAYYPGSQSSSSYPSPSYSSPSSSASVSSASTSESS